MPRTALIVTAGIALIALAIVTAAAIRAPLRVFNAAVPKDWGSSRIAEGIAYGAGDRRRLDIYAPSGTRANAHLPVIVFFYGGWWSSGVRSGYAFVGRALAAHGFLVVIPDYRLVPHVTFPAFVQDAAAAVKWTQAHVGAYGGDPDRIVLAGHSAGAHIGALLAMDPQWLGTSRAAIRGFAGVAGPYDFYPFEAEQTKAALGHWPRPMETQPITWASAGDPPALLLTGAMDDTVRPRNSEALAARLHASDVPVELKSYAGVGHIGILTAFALPLRHRAAVVDDIAAFAHRVSQP
ncbi:MAG TPA: alpha/beta hydrolase [Sphingobium sp.]